MYIIYTEHARSSLDKQYTVNRERFAGLNFRSFRGFLEDHESFSMNILHKL